MQWHCDSPELAYRCGGSAGIAFITRTGFPFHSGDEGPAEHLKRWTISGPRAL